MRNGIAALAFPAVHPTPRLDRIFAGERGIDRATDLAPEGVTRVETCHA
jgi:hypothetical protein